MTARPTLRLRRIHLRADVELRLYRERRRSEITDFLRAMAAMYGWAGWSMLPIAGRGQPIVFEFYPAIGEQKQ